MDNSVKINWKTTETAIYDYVLMIKEREGFISADLYIIQFMDQLALMLKQFNTNTMWSIFKNTLIMIQSLFFTPPSYIESNSISEPLMLED